MRNRVWLAVAGSMLAAAGGTALAAGLSAFGPHIAGLPLWTDAMSAWIVTHGWYWPLVAITGCVVALLGLAWALGQLRGRRLSKMAVGGGIATRMAVRVATRAISADVCSYLGVRRTRVRFTGTRRRPQVVLRVTCDERADIADLSRRIHDDALVRLRTTLERDDLGGVVDFRLLPAERVTERTVG